MNNGKQETIADIVAWLRRPREGENAYLTLWLGEIADRIEAAEKQSVTNCNRLGNAAAMSEALGEISRKIWESIDPFCNDDCCKPKRELAKIADAALASPPRNCDVGTAWEQFQRFNMFCSPIKCRECKLYTEEDFHDCIFRWAQLPYEEGDSK